MPTLDWIGKQAVVNHHLEVPYRLLKCDASLSAGDPEAGNLLVQGDNLLALKALLPYYAGQVKCICIDPPYNTGKENWKFNDNVNTPEIKTWLSQVVGKEGEDLSRHDKWLCMMYPRLNLLYKFLKEDGVIFVFIDDNEIHNLTLIMDEIFGEKNRLAILVWDLGTGTTAGHFTRAHEYILAYAKRKDSLPQFKDFSNSPIIERATKRPTKANPFSEITFPAGMEFEGTDTEFSGTIGDKEPIRIKNGKMVFENGKLKYPITLEAAWAMRNQILSWIQGEETFDSKGQKVVKFFFTKKGAVWYEKIKGVLNPKTTIKIASTRKGSSTLDELFGHRVFNFPKPPELIEYLLNLITSENDLILDSYSGSGTTGHAVLRCNKDGSNRRFILVEMEEDICRNVTAERLKRVINGYSDKEGLGGGFRYCKLGEPLFDEYGNIRDGVKFNDLAHHIFFSETGLPIPKNAKKSSPLIGIHAGKAYYLLFNGVLGDKSVSGGNILTSKIIAQLPEHNGPKIIFGEGTRIGLTRLRKENITFKQIPYEIKTN